MIRPVRWRQILPVLATVLAAPVAGAQDSKAVLDRAARALGAADLASIQYSGTGLNFALGQSVRPDAPWPRFNVTSFTALVDYRSGSLRQEMTRTQGENPPRGGGGQPMAGEQRQVQVVSGDFAWNVAGDAATPAAAALVERQLQIWVTPHGFVRGAMAHSASASPGRGGTVVTFTLPNKHRVRGTIDGQGLVTGVETWIANQVLGDMPIETSYTDYRDFGGVKFPARIVQKQGGHPTLDLSITDVRPNAPAAIAVPDNVRQAPPPSPLTVVAQKAAEGVWYLTGGSHHSVAVEFRDHVVVIEGPQSEARSLAVIAKVRETVPGKPIRFLVNTHHHFDHSGGIRTYAAEGATIITHEMNRPYYEKAFAAARTLDPDSLSTSKRKAVIETVKAGRVLSDGARVLQLHHVAGNTHNDGMLMAYLPQERLLIEADVFTPGPAGAPPPAVPNPFSVNLYENLQRLKLDVGPIAPIHGRLVTMADLLRVIGKTGS
jgi:glyoxylase-like metal-dependent hydrolase (beta-lactamase superfamily II)